MPPTIPGCTDAGPGESVCPLAPAPPAGAPATLGPAEGSAVTHAGSATVWLLVALLVLAVAAVTLALIWWRRWHDRQRETAAGTRLGPSSSERSTAAVAEQPPQVGAIINAYDVASDDHTRQQLIHQLASRGVIKVPVSCGDMLDPRVHNVVGRRTAGPGAMPQTVAAIERPGWITAGAGIEGLIRPADVSAWV